jgi:hypothetical protein
MVGRLSPRISMFSLSFPKFSIFLSSGFSIVSNSFILRVMIFSVLFLGSGLEMVVISSFFHESFIDWLYFACDLNMSKINYYFAYNLNKYSEFLIIEVHLFWICFIFLTFDLFSVKKPITLNIRSSMI